MSSQRGNVIRHRPQKYKNQSSFKNTLHCNEKTKFINNLRAEGCCTRCKDIIEWKIKYKKYKPLTQPKKCQDGAGVSGSYSDKDCDDSDNGSDDVPSDNEGSDNNDTEDLEDKVTHLDLHQHKQDTLQRSISDEVYSNSRVNNYSDVSNDIDV
ncbi:hypothetical protein LSH36_425g02050 [Paralvinella palmiformis]|uniref:Uncharacterized protein n=1 Tax=Paralvinella palmiformis TaxID=53620 RepID=A0AAD9N034_9ANNE|nr:hypothetical protein LSH36_425g02050 [Paralvinella palmiformis]